MNDGSKLGRRFRVRYGRFEKLIPVQSAVDTFPTVIFSSRVYEIPGDDGVCLVPAMIPFIHLDLSTMP